MCYVNVSNDDKLTVFLMATTHSGTIDNTLVHEQRGGG